VCRMLYVIGTVPTVDELQELRSRWIRAPPAAAPAATAARASEAVKAAKADAETNVCGTGEEGVVSGARRGKDTCGAAEGARAPCGGSGGSGDGGFACRWGGG